MKRNVTKTWGTWYTDGERADAWPEETRSASGPGVVRSRDALLSGSVHGFGGGGPGLSGFLGEALTGHGRSTGGLL